MEKKNLNNSQEELLKRYLEGKCSLEEEQYILKWFYSFEEPKEELEQGSGGTRLSDEINERLHIDLFGKKKNRKVIPKGWNRVAVAAMGLFILGAILWIGINSLSDPKGFELAPLVVSETGASLNDILPGTYYAKLKWANGEEQIRMDSAFYSSIVNDATESKKLAIEVPKAGMYKVILEDGTKVWLNSATEISYLERFASNERRVQLKGEAYFEVAKDAKRPFRIVAGQTIIEVLGTTFNVNAYKKKVTTSLVEGSVKIIEGSQQKMLKPGQEAVVQDNKIKIEKVDLDKSTAWQRGEFYFEGNNLEEIFGQISRWYDVEFETNVDWQDEIIYKGGISRQNNLSKVLQILELATQHKFEIIGRKVIMK